MVDSHRRLPDSQFDIPFHTSKYQDFYSWLKTMPRGALHDLYMQYNTKKGFRVRDTVDRTQDDSVSQNNSPQAIATNVISLRRSVFILIFDILAIEIFFDILYLALKAPSLYFQFSSTLNQALMPIYFAVFIAFNVLKFVLIFIVATKWVTNSYVIAQGEIRYRSGIFSHKEKIYLCAHAQEVTYSQGIIGKLCNYGSVEIYDPAITERIYLDSIPNPKKYVEVIKKNINSSLQGDYIVMQTATERHHI